jgi:predicted Ser/Thr protein kinase/tetratricopeptide (TPR) repeat protein
MQGNLSGQLLAHFRILEKIGEGGMGVVYLAHDEKLDRDVALKVLPEDSAHEPDHRHRFLREARSAAAVSHPNIATIFEVGEQDGRVFIAMEFIRGQSLRQSLADRLSVREVLRIARSTALGLGEAHDRGIVHRDLKPENVMITSKGDVKILDFGLAKLHGSESPTALGDAKTELQITQQGRLLGTPEYMSPEQARGEPVGAEGDIFSLGVMLYEMLAGERPFKGATPLGVLLAATTQEPIPLSARNAAITPELEQVVAKCLEKRPSDRFANGKEVGAALEALLDAGGSASLSSAARSALNSRAEPPRARRGWPVLVAALALTGAGAFGWAAWIRSSHQLPADIASSREAGGPAQTPDSSKGYRAITDLPRPGSSSRDAVAAYRRGMQLTRDAAYHEAQEEFEAALRLDGSLAAAHLRYALLSFSFALSQVQPGQLAHFRAAVAGRASLSDHDEQLLEAVEPAFEQPRRLSDSVNRLAALVARYPEDVDDLFWHALMLYATGAPDEAMSLFKRATLLDPKFCLAWARYGDVIGNMSSDADAAFGAYDACSSACPNATRCLRSRLLLAAHEGACTRAFGRRAASRRPRTARSGLARASRHDAIRRRRDSGGCTPGAPRGRSPHRGAATIPADTDRQRSGRRAGGRLHERGGRAPRSPYARDERDAREPSRPRRGADGLARARDGKAERGRRRCERFLAAGGRVEPRGVGFRRGSPRDVECAPRGAAPHGRGVRGAS